MNRLDAYTPKMITLMKLKGGVVGTKLRPYMDILSQVCLLKIVLVHSFEECGLFLTHYTLIQYQSSLNSQF